MKRDRHRRVLTPERMTVRIAMGAALLGVLAAAYLVPEADDEQRAHVSLTPPTALPASEGSAVAWPADPPRSDAPTDGTPRSGGASVTASIVAGAPCAAGQVVVEAALEPDRPDARFEIGRARGRVAVVDLPRRGNRDANDPVGRISVRARLGRDVVAETVLKVPLPPCEARLVATAQPTAATKVRVRVTRHGDTDALGGQSPRLRYDFGQGDVEVTRERDVTFDYGPDAEGRDYLITVTALADDEETSAAEAGTAGATEGRGLVGAGLVGYATVAFPDLAASRALQARFDALQREQNQLADRLGYRND